MSDITSDGSSLKFSVTVTNTGSAAGKDVVEIYNDPPYTNGGIEKASANLLDFAKTSELAPGESETIDFTIPVEDLASYDYKNNGCYVLEAGDYIISTNSDAHNVLDSKTYTVASDIVYNESNKRESDEVVAINQFDFAEGEITYLSRADGFANYDEAIAAPATYEMSDEPRLASRTASPTPSPATRRTRTPTQRTSPPAQRTVSSWLTCAAWTTTTPSGMTCWMR